MTYQEMKNTQQAKEWTIGTKNGKFQPKHNGIPVGKAHDTIEEARIFIMCDIQWELNADWRESEKNRLYRDFDIC